MTSSYRSILGLCVLLALLCGSGCQLNRPSIPGLLEARARTDQTDLTPVAMFEDVRATGQPPEGWTAQPVNKVFLYKHQQWRSPGERVALGVVYVRLPIPLGAKVVVAMAQSEYQKRGAKGQVGKQWSDTNGREWFEGANEKFRARGYAMSNGWDAWIVYCGSYLTDSPDSPDVERGYRSLETFIPALGGTPAEGPRK